MHTGHSLLAPALFVVIMATACLVSNEVGAQVPPNNLDRGYGNNIAIKPAPANVDRDYEVIFDEFIYENAEACKIDQPPCSFEGKNYDWDSPLVGSLFSLNDWAEFRGPSGSRGWTSRQDQGWYRFNWQNGFIGTGAGIDVSQQQTAGGGLRLWFDAGYNFDPNRPTVRSGFGRLAGTWATRVKLTDIDHDSNQTDDVHQAFWLFNSFTAQNPDTTKKDFWSEMDHEWNNWFSPPHTGLSNIPDDTGFDATGYFEETPDENLGPAKYHNNMPSFTPLMHAPNEDEDDHLTCSITVSGQPTEVITDSEECMHYFVYHHDCPPGTPDCERRWIYLSIHYYDNGNMVFRMGATTPGEGSMNMYRLVDNADFPPTQPLISMFSQGFRKGQDPLDSSYEMKADWFYYASDPDLTVWNVGQHVNAIRAEGIERLHIVPPGETAETFQVERNQISASAGDCENNNPPDPPTVELLDPTETQGNADYVWAVRPTPRATLSYEIEWRERYIYENGEFSPGTVQGGLTRRTPPDAYTVPPSFGNVVAVEMSVLARDLELCGNQESASVSRTYYFGGCGPFCATATAVSLESPPLRFDLASVHPNPAHNNAAIRYTVPDYTEVKLTVVDVLGREVTVLTDDYLAPGVYTTTLNANYLPSGVYFIRMKAGTFRATRRITVIN